MTKFRLLVWIVIILLLSALVTVPVSCFTRSVWSRRPLVPCHAGHATVTALYQAKTITCRTNNDETFGVLLFDEMAFTRFCEDYDIALVVDDEGWHIFSFDYASLDDGAATYYVSRKNTTAALSGNVAAVYPSSKAIMTGTTQTTGQSPSRWKRIVAFLQRARRKVLRRQFEHNAASPPEKAKTQSTYFLLPPPKQVKVQSKFTTMPPPEQVKMHFNYSTLPKPEQVRPLILDQNRPEKHVCPHGFRESLLNTVYKHMEQWDTGRRVPPMALVGCSRSGKTRTLAEIAESLAQNETHPVVVLSVTFNDYSTSPITGEDQENPLQALCQRIVFVAMRSIEENDSDQVGNAYELFREQDYHIDPKEIVHWLAGSRVILLVDELNFLKGLTSKSPQAYEFGDFIRKNFLSHTGRYFVFSSHILGTVSSLNDIIDSSGASSREVKVQLLPVIDDLGDVVLYLNPRMDTPLEAIFYGLLPGLIFDQGMGIGFNGKMRAAVETFNLLPLVDKELWIVKIFESLFSGKRELVPPQFQILLTARPVAKDKHDAENDLAKISWVPYILQFVLRKADLGERRWLAEAANSVATLCNKLPKAQAGKGYENLFGIIILARSIARLPDGVLLPAVWFDDPTVEVMLNPFSAKAAGKTFSDCKRWTELQKGIRINSLHPTIAIYLPGNDFFESYDVIAVYLDDGQLVDCRAFQLKVGSHDQRKPPEAEAISIRFLFKGKALQSGKLDDHGWLVPSAAAINDFFGESGRYWTPAEWARLKATLVRDDDDDA